MGGISAVRCCLLLLIVLLGVTSYSSARRASGSSSRSSSRSSFGRSSSSRWGSSSRSGSTWRSSGSSSNSRYGSSSRSGSWSWPWSSSSSSTRYGSSGSSGYSPSSPLASARKSNAPTVLTPSVSRSQPTKVVYSNTYNTFSNGRPGMNSVWGSGAKSGHSTGTLVGSNLASGAGGYALGRMMGSRTTVYHSYGGYGYGYGYPYGCWGGCYNSYVPYRSRYYEYYPSSTVSSVVPVSESPKSVDICMLARWNRELAFAELPNMALDFLVNNNVSGNSTSDKAKFMYEFLMVSVDTYENYNNSADIFAIPPAFDLAPCNIVVSKSAFMRSVNPVKGGDPIKDMLTKIGNMNYSDPSSWKATMDEVDRERDEYVESLFGRSIPKPAKPEEPILTSIRYMLSTYSNKSTSQASLQLVVDATKACLPQGPNVTSPEILGCIDFSLSPEQLLKLQVPHSMFGSSEICRRQLRHDMFKCLPKAADSSCRMEHLSALNLFARNFYLCDEEYIATTPGPVTTEPSVIYVTTGQPRNFWSKIFG